MAVLKTLSQDELLLEATAFLRSFATAPRGLAKFTTGASVIRPSWDVDWFSLLPAGGLFLSPFLTFRSSFSFFLNQRKNDWKPVLEDVELELERRESLVCFEDDDDDEH